MMTSGSWLAVTNMETQIEFQAPGFILTWAWLLQAFGKGINEWKISLCLTVSLSLCVCLSNERQYK